MSVFHCAIPPVCRLIADRAESAAENCAPRQRLANLRKKVKRANPRRRDRIFWAIRSRTRAGWRSSLLIVHPDTVVRRHRQGFKMHWRWNSQAGKVGRPKPEAEFAGQEALAAVDHSFGVVVQDQRAVASIGQRFADRLSRRRDQPPPSDRLVHLPKDLHSSDHGGRWDYSADVLHGLFTRKTVRRWIELAGADVLNDDTSSPAIRPSPEVRLAATWRASTVNQDSDSPTIHS